MVLLLLLIVYHRYDECYCSLFQFRFVILPVLIKGLQKARHLVQS